MDDPPIIGPPSRPLITERYQEYPGLEEAAGLAEAAVGGPPGELVTAMAAPVPTPVAAITAALASIIVCLRVIMISVTYRFGLGSAAGYAVCAAVGLSCDVPCGGTAPGGTAPGWTALWSGAGTAEAGRRSSATRHHQLIFCSR